MCSHPQLQNVDHGILQVSHDGDKRRPSLSDGSPGNDSDVVSIPLQTSLKQW